MTKQNKEKIQITNVPRACNTERFTTKHSHLQDDLHTFEHRPKGQPEVPTGEPVDAAGAEVVDIWEGLLELFLRVSIHTCISAYTRRMSSAERSVDFGKHYDIVLHDRPNCGVLRYGHKWPTELMDLNRRLEALAAAGMELFEVREWLLELLLREENHTQLSQIKKVNTV